MFTVGFQVINIQEKQNKTPWTERNDMTLHVSA
jgi:hypothetical protein